MLAFLASLFIALLAMAGAFFRMLSRSKEFRKARSGLSPQEIKGEEFQDISALLGAFATFFVVMAAIFIVEADVTREVRLQAAIAFLALWLLGMIYIVVLNKKYKAPGSDEHAAKADVE